MPKDRPGSTGPGTSQPPAAGTSQPTSAGTSQPTSAVQTSDGVTTSAGVAAADRPAARRPRKAVLTGVLSAVVLLAVGGGAVSAAGLLPGPKGERMLDIPLADVPAGRATDVCPQPARLLEGTPVGTDPQFSPASSSAKSYLDAVVLSGKEGALPGSRITDLSGASVAEISATPTATPTPTAGAPALKAGVVAQRPVSGTNVVAAEAVRNQQPSVAAIMSYSATDGDLRGSAAAACQQPGNDYWILGADTTLGRTAVLNLSNASATPATVSLELFGAKGQVQAGGSRGLLVPPGTTRSVVLAGLAANEASLAVHVRSVGGPVAATIQQSTLRGLTPGGVDFLAPGASPSVRQIMTGVDIPDAGALKALTGKSGFQDAAPVLHIAVPGSADAVVEVKLFGSNGQRALPGGGVVTAKGGSVTEVPLAGVPAGTYTVTAASDVAVVASARVFRGSKAEDPTDFAWSPAAVRMGSQHVVAVPQGGTSQLSFGAPDGRAKISLSPVTADGTVRKTDTIDIAGGTTATVKIPDKVEGAAVVGYVVSASGDAVYGALLMGKDGRSDVAVAAIQPGAVGQEKVPVTLGY